MGILTALFFPRANKAIDQRKSALADRIIAHSLSVTDPSVQADSRTPYATRLHDILMTAKPYALEHVIENKIAICLDHRLPHARREMYGPFVEALLYNDPTKILSLSDSGWGKEGNDPMIFKHRDTINDLCRIPEALSETLVLTRAPVFTGNTVLTGWRDAAEEPSTFMQNPQLHKAPSL